MVDSKNSTNNYKSSKIIIAEILKFVPDHLETKENV